MWMKTLDACDVFVICMHRHRLTAYPCSCPPPVTNTQITPIMIENRFTNNWLCVEGLQRDSRKDQRGASLHPTELRVRNLRNALLRVGCSLFAGGFSGRHCPSFRQARPADPTIANTRGPVQGKFIDRIIAWKVIRWLQTTLT